MSEVFAETLQMLALGLQFVMLTILALFIPRKNDNDDE